MKARFLVIACLAALSMSALAGPKKAPAMAPKCKVCKMALSAKKTKANPVAVKMGKKTMYCCSKCDMKMKK